MTGGPAPARPQGTPRAWGTILFGVPSSLWSRDGEVSSRLEPKWLRTHRHTHTQTQGHTETQTHRHTDTQRNRDTQKDIHIGTQTHRHTDTKTRRHADTQTYRHTDTKTHRHTDTQTQRHTVFSILRRKDDSSATQLPGTRIINWNPALRTPRRTPQPA